MKYGWHFCKLVFGMLAYWSIIAMLMPNPNITTWGAVIGSLGYFVCSFVALPSNTGE